MSELASYSIQAVFFALVAVVVVSRSKKTDLYQFALILFWLIGVIAIYIRYGDGQTLFYSNDQDFHLLVINNLIPTYGINIGSIISQRYVVTLPVYFLSLLGFNAVLAFKFIQLLSMLFLYKHVKEFIRQKSRSIEVWHVAAIAGPLLFFFSLLALRDVVIAYFAVSFIFSLNSIQRNSSIFVVGLLRPHLAVALLFGVLIEKISRNSKVKFNVLSTAIKLFISYVFGSISFQVGDYLTSNKNLSISTALFSAKQFSQIALNFFGLQFLALNGSENGVVAASTLTLLMARIVFVETYIVPVAFLVILFQPLGIYKKEFVQIATALFFFYGLILQNVVSTNSTRQNIPFISLMGVAAVVYLTERRRLKYSL